MLPIANPLAFQLKRRHGDRNLNRHLDVPICMTVTMLQCKSEGHVGLGMDSLEVARLHRARADRE